MGILRLAHVDVRTPDLELSTAYYTEVLGLQLAERGEDTVYLKCWDEEDHHSVRLRYDPRTGLDLFSFRVEHADDLAELEKAVEAYGCQVQRLSRGEAVGQGESIRFGIPSGQTMELVYELDKTGNIPCSPALARSSASTPPAGAATVCSIFIASSTRSGWPATTTAPTSTRTRRTSPGIGASSDPAGASSRGHRTASARSGR